MACLLGPDGREIVNIGPAQNRQPELYGIPTVDLKRVEKCLEKAPARIRELKAAAAQARAQREEAEQALALAEAELAAAVAAEAGPNGKPQFPNQEARAAELTIRRARSPEYRRAYEAARQARERAEAAGFDLEMELDKFKALKTAAELMAAELRALSV